MLTQEKFDILFSVKSHRIALPRQKAFHANFLCWENLLLYAGGEKRCEVRAQEAAFQERAVACFTGSVKKEKNCWQGLEFGL